MLYANYISMKLGKMCLLMTNGIKNCFNMVACSASGRHYALVKAACRAFLSITQGNGEQTI